MPVVFWHYCDDGPKLAPVSTTCFNHLHLLTMLAFLYCGSKLFKELLSAPFLALASATSVDYTCWFFKPVFAHDLWASIIIPVPKVMKPDTIEDSLARGLQS